MVIDYSKCPEHLRDSFRGYVEQGRRVGHFLTACLTNNLMEAVGRADEKNVLLLKEITSFMWSELPLGCFGSSEKVKLWTQEGGLKGRDSERVGNDYNDV